MKRLNYILLAFGLLQFILTSCGPNGMISRMVLHRIKPKHDYCQNDSSYTPNYQLTSSWLVSENKNKAVDIFFIHPTSYLIAEHWNMPIDDTATIARTRKLSLRRILSIFEDLGNVYAPKYRQATFYAFVDHKSDGEKAIDLARKDVLNAFDYYIKNINQGRPFILAAHSQGSLISMDILPMIFNDSTLKKQLITAYVVGWPIHLDYLNEHPEITVCEDSMQTGCIISWNSETKHAGATIVDKSSLCINPLSWQRDEIYISKEKNMGAVIYESSPPDTIPHYIGAQCKSGILRIGKIPNRHKLKGPTAFGMMHWYDYNFFYLNVKHNAQLRIQNYYQKQLSSPIKTP